MTTTDVKYLFDMIKNLNEIDAITIGDKLRIVCDDGTFVVTVRNQSGETACALDGRGNPFNLIRTEEGWELESRPSKTQPVEDPEGRVLKYYNEQSRPEELRRFTRIPVRFFTKPRRHRFQKGYYKR